MTTIRLRRGTAAQWTLKNPVLSEGEAGVETDTVKVKIGNGTTPWNSLDYFLSSSLDSLEEAVAVLSASVVETDAVAVELSTLSDTITETVDDQDSTIEDLTRKFRLLLKAWLALGLPPPDGLQDEFEAALTQE